MSLSIGSLFTLIIVLLVVGILVWLAFYVLQNFGPPEPLNRIFRVVIVVIAVLIVVLLLLQLAGIGPGITVSGASPLINSLWS